MKKQKLLFFIFVYFLISCSANKSLLNSQNVELLGEKTIFSKVKCFPENLKYENGNNVFAEISGAEYVDGYLYLINDKPIEGLTPIFKIPFSKSKKNFSKKIIYLKSPVIVNTEKFEDITVTLDKKYILATTAFDRIDSNSNKWDCYNKIVYWKVKDENKVEIISPTEDSGVISSKSLRKYFQEALIDEKYPEGPDYFKIEGLTVIPNNKILFGIREYGKTYKNFTYVIKILCAEYYIENGKIILKDNITLINDFDNKLNLPDKSMYRFGISGLIYEKTNNMLYVLTSFENENSEFDGNIWYISLPDFFAKKPLKLLCSKNGEPITFFPHKPESIALIDANTLIIVCDDDRKVEYEIIKNGEKIRYNRLPNEAWYNIIKIKKKKI